VIPASELLLCEWCVAGKFKNSMGSAACSDCSNPTATTVGANSDACQACSANSGNLATTHGYCVCNNGFMPEVLSLGSNTEYLGSTESNVGTCISGCSTGSTGPNAEQCALCVAGKYKSSTGSAECTDCEAGTYSTTVGAVFDVCQDCPMHSVSMMASDSPVDCICNAGFSGMCEELCTQCLVGKYRAAPLVLRNAKTL